MVSACEGHVPRERNTTMRRKVFDILASVGGIVVVVVLLIAGGLLAWGASFIGSNVHHQLAEQQIYFPPKQAFAHAKPGTEITPSMIPSVSRYAGEELLTGAQAEAYANDFIAVHLSEMPYHGVYALISQAARSAKPGSPQAAELEKLAFVSFEGTTLRGLLLEVYAFSVIGEIAEIASIAAFALAAVMAVLVVFGFVHARRDDPNAELLSRLLDRERRAPHTA
jgi:hypothetical protein